MSENFQDNIAYGGSTLSISGKMISLGSEAGAKSIQFNNSDTAGVLAWSPSVGQTINLPDAVGGVTLLTSQTVQTQSNIQAIYDGANSISTGTIRFTNANGVSFSINGQTISASISQTNQTIGFYGLGNTTQNSSTTLDARTVSFNGLGQMTVGYSNGSIQLSVTAPPIGTAVKAIASVGSTGTITRFAPEDHQHAGVAAFAVTNTGNTAGNTRSQVGTVFIAASGGITASQSTGAAGNDTVWLSVATPVAQTTQSAIKAFGASNTGNTAGNTGVSTGIDWVIAGSNNITISQSTAAGGPNTIWVSGAAGGGGNTLTFYASSNTTQSSTGTVNVSSIVFAGAGIASVGITNGSVVISVPSGGGAGDGGVFAGVSTGGNTAGSTGTVSTGNFVLVGSNNITLSQSTGAAGSAATVSIIGPSTSQLTFVPPISLSSNGATISIMLASTLTLSYWEPVAWYSTTLTQPAQNTAYFNKWNVDDAVDCGVLAIPVVMTAGWTSTNAVVTNSTATTSSSTSFSAGNTYSYGLWSMGTGGYSTNLYTYFTNSCSFSTKIQWTQSNSNSTTGTQSYGYSVAFTYGGPTLTTGTKTSQNAGSTVTTWATTTFSSTGSSTVSSNGNTTSVWPGGTTNASWAGSRIMYLPFSTSMTPGLQWFGLVRSSTTTGAAVAGSHSLVNVTWSTYDSGLRWAPFGLRTADFSGLFYHPAFQIEGYRTNGSSFNWTSNYVASGSSVGAIALSQIGPNAASDFNATATFSRFYVKLMNNMFL